MFVYVLLLPRMYVCMFVYVLAGIFTYLYIFPLPIGGKRRGTKEESMRRMSEGGGNGLWQSEFLFLSNLMVAKGLFI